MMPYSGLVCCSLHYIIQVHLQATIRPTAEQSSAVRSFALNLMNDLALNKSCTVAINKDTLIHTTTCT